MTKWKIGGAAEIGGQGALVEVKTGIDEANRNNVFPSNEVQIELPSCQGSDEYLCTADLKPAEARALAQTLLSAADEVDPTGKDADAEMIHLAKKFLEWQKRTGELMSKLRAPGGTSVFVVVTGEHAACLDAWYDEHKAAGSGPAVKHRSGGSGGAPTR